MNRDDTFSSLKCFFIANFDFLTKRDIYFFTHKIAFKQQSLIFSFSTGIHIFY